MTALAQGCCEDHHRAIRRKVIANLAELEQHAQLSQQFRAVASHLQQHWYAIDSAAEPGAGDEGLAAVEEAAGRGSVIEGRKRETRRASVRCIGGSTDLVARARFELATFGL